MTHGIEDSAMRTAVQALEKLGVRPLATGMWACTCKLCKRDRVFTMAEMLGLRILSIAFCKECLNRLGVATMPAKPRIIVPAQN